jgi:HEAT repeat protein
MPNAGSKSLVALIVFLGQAHAQNGSPPRNSGPVPFSVYLTAHGVDTSEPSLVAALSNSDPIVRSFAALQLMSDRDFQAMPSIEKALSTETDNQARIGMASALAGAGDRVGAATLEAVCMDPSLPVEVTASAVRQLASAEHSHPTLISMAGCAGVVLAALENVSEEYKRWELLQILPSVAHDAPSDKANRMVTEAQSLLGSKDPTTRMNASRALAEMGSTASTDLIRNAMQRETDPSIRAWHQHDLDTLQKLQQPQ